MSPEAVKERKRTMKVTKIRNEKGMKLEPHELETLQEALTTAISKAGFLADVVIQGPTRMKISDHGAQCHINTEIRGYNGRINSYYESPKGYKRTNVPTWKQREEFNHLINDIFDRYSIQANISSGPFKVRDYPYGRNNSWDEYECPYLPEIYPENEVRKMLNSDKLEAEYAEKMKIERKEKSKEHRKKRKAIDQAKYVMINDKYDWKSGSRKRIIVTQSKYKKIKTESNRKDFSGWNKLNPVPCKGKSLKTAKPIEEQNN